MNMKNFPKRLDSKTSYLRITVPENLDLALEGLIRKVLKEQPKTDDIYSFAADYFETLLKIRDKAGAKFIADELCPFHNDDAHEMIKLAGTFPKPGTEELRKKNEEFQKPKTKSSAGNKDSDNKIQDKRNVRKPKPKKVSKDEEVVEKNEQVTSKTIKKLPKAFKNVPEEVNKQINTANISDNINLDKNIKKEESDDEEFSVSDPIKELVEKELMETKLSGKREEIKENITTGTNTPVPSANKNIPEQKPVDNNNVQQAINDANESLSEESKVNLEEKNKEHKSEKETEENKVTKEKEIKPENNEVVKQASEKSTTDVKEENKGKIADAEEKSNKLPENLEEENKESTKDTEKLNEENIKGATKIDPKITTNLQIVNEEKTKDAEKTSRSTENTEERKIITDKTSNLKTSEQEEQPLMQEIQSEEEINRQSTEMIKETTDGSSETLRDVTEKDTNKAIYNEISHGENISNVNHNIKEQEERNVKTPEEIPSNGIKPEEKESEEPLSDQKTARVNDQIDTEKETQPPIKTAAKDENNESTAEQKTMETLVNLKSPLTEPDVKHDVEIVENNNNQEPKAQEQRTTDMETERTTKTEAKDIKSPKLGEAKEVLKKTEEFNNENDEIKVEQSTEQIKEIRKDETKNKQYALKNDEKPLETEKTVEDNKNENTIQNFEENHVQVLEDKTDEKKLNQEEIINTNKDIVDTKPEPESTVSQTDLKNNFSKKKPEVSSPDKESAQIEDKKLETSSLKPPPDPTNPNEIIKFEKKEKLSNENRVKATEDILFGEKTHDFQQSMNNESPQTPDDRKVEMSEIQDQQGVNENEESQLTNKEFVTQEEQNVRKLKNETLTSSDILSANKSDKEKPDEVLNSVTSDIGETQSKSSEIESEKETSKGESDDQKLHFKTEDKNARISEDKIEEDLRTETDIHQITKKEETSSEKPSEKSKSKDEFRTSNENEEDNLKPEEELCAVVDVQQIPKGNAIDRNDLKEKYKPEVENTQNKQYKAKMEERPVEEESPQVITVVETAKTEENQEMPQPSKEMQIKTIQSHYYNTLQVPETVTKSYRVRNVSSPPISALLNAASSLQQSLEPKHESLNKEDRTEKIADVNMNSTSLAEEVTLEVATPTENIRFDLQSADPPKNSKTPANASNQNGLEADTQKSDSDDLLDLMTPTSGYSLNLSELSWQTVNELFLDSEKRNSSLEKEEIRYVTPKTSKTTGESAESRQEIEEIIYKTVVPSNIEAVPVPPRDLEGNTQTSENTEEKREEDKPEGESAESSDSSNEQISVNDDTPFISVEVKTVIETQILDDDDDENDHIRNKEQSGEMKMRPDMEIKVETTIDFVNEVEMTQSESESRENKMEATDGTRKNSLKSSLETQDKSRHVDPKESSSTEQTTGGEGSSGESDSTISSAATEIKRADFAKRNFSSTRSLLSTQSLDLEKKNPLVKTKSLSTFRHGVTDFEVWSTIEKELEKAATKIQSKFRGYKTRKKLQRENAMQITTEESSSSVTPVEAEIKNECQQSTGEFHDSIVLSEHPR